MGDVPGEEQAESEYDRLMAEMETRFEALRKTIRTTRDPIDRLLSLAKAQYERAYLPDFEAEPDERGYYPPEAFQPFTNDEQRAVAQSALDDIAGALAAATTRIDRVKYLRAGLTALRVSMYRDEIEDVILRLDELVVNEGAQLLPEDESRPNDFQVPAGSKTNVYHLALAAWILGNHHGTVGSKSEFIDVADSLQRGDGKPPISGATIWKGVHRLAKSRLAAVHLPDHYKGDIEAFRYLVRDLLFGDLKE